MADEIDRPRRGSLTREDLWQGSVAIAAIASAVAAIVSSFGATSAIRSSARGEIFRAQLDACVDAEESLDKIGDQAITIRERISAGRYKNDDDKFGKDSDEYFESTKVLDSNLRKINLISNNRFQNIAYGIVREVIPPTEIKGDVGYMGEGTKNPAYWNGILRNLTQSTDVLHQYCSIELSRYAGNW